MIDAYIEHGLKSLRIGRPRLSMRSQEVHSLSETRRSETITDFPLGSAHPEYAGLRYVEREVDPDGPGYLLRLRAEGIADGSAFIEMGRQDSLAQDGWDQTSLGIYTADPKNARWVKGAQAEVDAISVAAEADDEIFTSAAAHGLTAGQLGILEFGSGFGGCTNGKKYLILPLGASTLRLADPANVKTVGKVDTTTNVLTTTARTATGITDAPHGLSNDQPFMFAALSGLEPLSASSIHYARDVTTNTFKVAATPGGAAIDLTGTITGYTAICPLISLSSDGAGGTLRPIEKGMELMWITDINRSKARAAGYYELELMLKGVNYAAGTGKAVSRRLSASAQAVSIDDFNSVSITGVPVYTGATDDALQRSATDHEYALSGKVSFDLPQVDLALTYISREAPPTWMLGSGMRWIPDDAPPIFVLGVTGATNTLYFPNGWYLRNLQSEQIPGQQLYLTSVVIGWQRAYTPG